MSRVYNDIELGILKNQQINNERFTEEELASLAKGDATLKISYRADKTLEAYYSFMQKPITRREVYSQFLTLNQYWKEVGQIDSSLVVLTETLLRMKIVNKEQLESMHHILVAEKWPHLCDECINTFPDCKGKPKFSIDTFADLTGKLADKVIECKSFARPPKEGTC